MPSEKELEKGKAPEEEEEKDIGELIDNDYEVGMAFKEHLVPLAVEYYMEVIEDDEDGEGCCSDDECDDKECGQGDSDGEDKHPGKKGGKKGGKGPGAAGAAGAAG